MERKHGTEQLVSVSELDLNYSSDSELSRKNDYIYILHGYYFNL